MCRSIKTLRRSGEVATEEEIQDAARQFVRKLSGYRRPSRLNEVVFEAAVSEIAQASRRLLDGLQERAPNSSERPEKPVSLPGK